MKQIAALLAPQYVSEGSTLAHCMKIVRADGAVYGFTDTDRELVIDGVTYESGFSVSDLATSAGLVVDGLEVTIAIDAPGGAISSAEMRAGRWDNAKFTIFECNHRAPSDGINVLRRGTTGEASQSRAGFRIEFRSLKQALQQQLGEVTTKTCRARLGDERCKVDLTPWTHTYQVTAVTSRGQFTCSAALEAADYYTEGIAHSDDGENEGYEQKVKIFAAGVFTLSLPMPFFVAVGDTFTFIAGCQKRLTEDCKDKFDNVLNFQGEPHIPGPDLLTADPELGDS